MKRAFFLFWKGIFPDSLLLDLLMLEVSTLVRVWNMVFVFLSEFKICLEMDPEEIEEVMDLLSSSKSESINSFYLYFSLSFWRIKWASSLSCYFANYFYLFSTPDLLSLVFFFSWLTRFSAGRCSILEAIFLLRLADTPFSKWSVFPLVMVFLIDPSSNSSCYR